ncbi:hypothetical protein ES703_125037 [subsurface metagenome]
MVKKEKVSKTPNEIRDIILKFFYKLHKKASSPKKSKIGILDLKRNLKEQNVGGNDVTSNLDYLVQTRWVVKEVEIFQIKTKKGMFVSSKKILYKASEKTMDYFEGISKFQKVDRSLSGINITNIKGITVIGDQNIIVNENYEKLYKSLGILSEVLRKDCTLSDEEKLNYSSEIETIKSQLSKKEPDRGIIKKIWEKLKPLATLSGIATFFQQTSQLISSLL